MNPFKVDKGKRKWLWTSVVAILVAVMVFTFGVGQVAPPQAIDDGLFTLSYDRQIFTIGTVQAAGITDYTCDGTDDNVQFQTAVDALPASGGKLVVLAGAYSFSAAVSRAINDVTIQGVGTASLVSRDGVNPCFDVGVQDGWTFRDISFDAGGISYASASTVTLANVYLGTTFYAYETSADITASEWSIPSGRTATIVVAANDSDTQSKAQADYVCDGTNDEVQVQAAHDALPATGGEIVLLDGTFTFEGVAASQVTIQTKPNVTISGQGRSTIIEWGGVPITTAKEVFAVGVNAPGFTLKDLTIDWTLYQGRLTLNGTDLANPLENVLIENVQFKADAPKVSSTATGGTVTTLVDNTKAWTPNEWVGYTAWVWKGTARGNHYEVLSNTNIQLTFAAGVAPAVGDSYIITVQGDEHHFIAPVFCEKLIVRGCSFEYSGDEFIDLMHSTDVEIHDNYAYECGFEGGTLVIQESQQVNVYGNIIKQTYNGPAMTIYAYIAPNQAGEDIQIFGNYIYAPDGIQVAGGVYTVQRVEVFGNILVESWSAADIDGVGFGGLLIQTANVIASDNIISGFDIGLRVWDDAENAKIYGNTILDSVTYGMLIRNTLATDVEGVEIRNNTIEGGCKQYGVQFTHTGAGKFPHLSFEGNTLRNINPSVGNFVIKPESTVDGALFRRNLVVDCLGTNAWYIQCVAVFEDNVVRDCANATAFGITTNGGWYYRNHADNNNNGFDLSGVSGNIMRNNVAENNATLDWRFWFQEADVAANTFLRNVGVMGLGETQTFVAVINYDDGSPVAICSVAEGYCVTDVWVHVVTLFDDAGARIDIGDGVDPNGYLDRANINQAVAGYYTIEADLRGAYLWDAVNGHARYRVYTGADTVDAVIVKTNGTQGKAEVYVTVTRIGY